MHTLSINDVVQIQDTIADIEYIGLLGYVSKITTTTVTVSFYTAQEKGENAYVTSQEFLISQVHFVGVPKLLPN